MPANAAPTAITPMTATATVASCRIGVGGLPVSPRRPVQDDVRVVGVAVARDWADPADTVAARPNTIDSSMDSKGLPATSRTKLCVSAHGLLVPDLGSASSERST